VGSRRVADAGWLLLHAEPAEDLIDAGELDRDGIDHFIAVVHNAARANRLAMSLTMFAVVARSG
jgi:hypothetical protein